MKIHEAVKEFMEWASIQLAPSTNSYYQIYLNEFADFCQGKNLHKITLSDIVKFQTHLRSRGLSNGSLMLYTQVLRSFFKVHNRLKNCQFNYEAIPVPKYTRVSHIPVERLEVEKMIDVVRTQGPFLSLRNEFILRFLFATGVRLSELSEMRITDLNLESRKAQIITKKNNRLRTILWDNRTHESLSDYLQARNQVAKTDLLLVGKDGKQIKKRTIYFTVKTVTRRANISRNIVTHSFRHGFGLEAVTRNLNIRYLQALLGHKSIDSTMIYMNYKDEKLTEEYHKLFKGIE